ncbi:MAG: NTP transferase domain-containing protein [Thaumarchaeota archaeon]|nr:NTP transferase domain-containing protein [Nitrososphaerota archaeon]
MANIPVVILAAGEATRLRPYSNRAPKCFMELEPGVTILDFILERVRSLGLDRVLDVTRPEFSKLFKERLGDSVEVIEVDRESFGNLYSLGLAAKKVKGPFLALMSDHIFEREMLRVMLERVEEAEESFVVCLDREPALLEAEEGLKLKLDRKNEGKVVKADKSLAPLHGIDTGIIFCNSSAKKYIQKALRKNGPEGSIKDALNLAAAEGQVGFVDVTGLLWKDVDTPRDLEKARNLYWSILKRELVRPSDGLVSRYLNRSVSTFLSVTLYRKRIFVSPNLVSLLSFLIALAGGVFLALRSFLLGGVLVQVSSIVDGMDGELARLFKRSSRLGGFLDSFLDRLADLSIIIGLALVLYPLSFFEIAVVALAAANTILVSYASHMLRSIGVDVDPIRRIPVTRDVRLFAVFLASVIGYPELSLYYIAFVPFAFYAAALLLLKGFTAPQFASGVFREKRRRPWPEIQPQPNLVKQVLSELIGRILKLALALLILKLFGPILSGFTLIKLENASLTSDDVLLVLEMGVIIYFGYAILSSTKDLADLIAVRLVGRVGATKETLKRVFLDLMYAALGLVAWIYATSLNRIPLIGDILSKLLMTAAAAFFFITLYRLGKRIYSVFADAYDRIIDRIAKKITKPAS